ncbi:MAG: putative serine/threonine-protein kinase [Myxococcales bacterium]|nr:putative serine/threonine-protein kinase [Myxococcales bacterium]
MNLDSAASRGTLLAMEPRMGILAPQTVFAGRYRIEALLGSGGMGQVYRAEHLGLGKDVALKVLGRRTQDFESRFEREARAIARLDHPGCIRILDHGEDETGLQYIAMELIDGPTLASTLANDGFSVTRALHVAKSLLSALAHAHAHGVIHRDIKPENVMFTLRGGFRVVLIDFGLATMRDAPALTGAGMAIGSPSYIAPERLLGHPTDQRGDLYAVGVILYEMISGQRPFLGGSPKEIMTNALSRPPRPLRALIPDVSPGLDAVIRRALAKDPDRRFADAEAMLSALSDVEAIDRAEPAPREEAEEASASMTISLLTVSEPSWLARLWSRLRYGAWRWRPGH